MERLDTNICALNGALQKTPEVLQTIGVDVAVHICFCVVNHFVGVFGLQSIVGFKRIGHQFRSWRNVLADLTVKMPFAACADYGRANPASLTIQQAEYN